MATERTERLAGQSRQLASERELRRYRRWSNLSLTKDVLIAALLLAGLGAVLSVGWSGLDLMALR